jgi:hypothetical protein
MPQLASARTDGPNRSRTSASNTVQLLTALTGLKRSVANNITSTTAADCLLGYGQPCMTLMVIDALSKWKSPAEAVSATLPIRLSTTTLHVNSCVPRSSLRLVSISAAHQGVQGWFNMHELPEMAQHTALHCRTCLFS